MLNRLMIFKHVFIISGLVILVYAVSILIGYPIGCIIERLTAIECFSCGMSSAWYHALHGDFATAFYFHPLYPLPLILAICLFLDYIVFSDRKKIFKYIYAISIVLIVVVYIMRITGVLDGFVPLNIRPWFI